MNRASDCRSFLRDVFRFTLNEPYRVLPQKKVIPRKSNSCGLLPSSVGLGPSEASKFEVSRFLFGKFPAETSPYDRQGLRSELIRIGLKFKAGQKIISKPEQVRLAPTFPTNSALEPKVQYVVEIDIRQQRREYRTLWGADFSRMNDTISWYPLPRPK